VITDLNSSSIKLPMDPTCPLHRKIDGVNRYLALPIEK
jgi:hypothetical protein